MDDHIAIQNLVMTYAERIDLGDFEGVAELFEHGAITAEPGDGVEIRGRDAVLDMYSTWTKRFADTGTPKTKHVTTNLMVDLDESRDRATCRSYFTVLQQTDLVPLQPIIAGRYHDTFERVEGQWRFSHRHIISDLFGDLSDHLLRTVAE